MRTASVFLLLLAIITIPPPASSQRSTSAYSVLSSDDANQTAIGRGDGVRSSVRLPSASSDDSMRASIRLSPDYQIGVGDLLTIDVKGRVDLRYGVQSTADPASGDGVSTNNYEVTPDGRVNLPLIGPVEAAGKTVNELEQVVTEKLSAYFKHFTVHISVASLGMIRVWVSGQVANPGPQALTSSATVLEALLRADILPTGSTRRIRLTRNGNSQTIDLFSIINCGELQDNITLAAGDEIHVPAVVDWVTVTGEVCRPGHYEMVPPPIDESTSFTVKSLLNLSEGLLPTAALSKAVIERRGTSDQVTALHVDLSSGENPVLQPGDNLIVPSVIEYQPIIRLVGEFKGENVYQRTAGAVLNKSGIYRLAKGETAGDVIARTGGTTPQADLKRAKIERRKNNKIEIIPLDLDRLVTYQDKSADVVLENGDTIILPALLDKVYVLGQVHRPGSISYEPERRLLDYLASAGGPSSRAKSSALIVRGDPDKPEVIKVSLNEKGITNQDKDNPVLEPGDVVYVPEGIITDWRDISQIISTVRLLTLF
ncbi:MAG TPA: SLBB domain-containing protein [Armatimonadota bacterium]|nr:SLBB domain-containing protein [Armatimonadota bacterium]